MTMKHEMKFRRILAAGLLCLVALSGCGQSAKDRPDVSALGEIHVIAREEGSGTRTQFESLLDTQESGTTQVASSTEDVIAEVAKDPSAIGYVAMSALPDGADVNVLSVDGTAPTASSIRHKKYPLNRSYYLAWIGDQSDLEKEFLTYIRGAGQKIVAKDAVPVSQESTFFSMKPQGTLKIAGSTSMTPMMQELAKDYETYNPNADIQIEETDSTQGLTDAMQSKIDMAMSSRDLKDYEQQILSYKAIAADGIVIIVNKQNALTDLEKSEIKDIFDGKVTEWGDL